MCARERTRERERRVESTSTFQVARTVPISMASESRQTDEECMPLLTSPVMAVDGSAFLRVCSQNLLRRDDYIQRRIQERNIVTLTAAECNREYENAEDEGEEGERERRRRRKNRSAACALVMSGTKSRRHLIVARGHHDLYANVPSSEIG